ncbi:ribosomal RNA small subunit methyltransferase A [bacterium]|nr:ribosomal RNA small subunit methyltransferase A [bacterium]
MFIDSHTHLDSDDYREDLPEVISKAHQNGLYAMINAGVDLPSSKRGVAISEHYLGLWSAVGIHPHQATEWTPDNASALRVLAGHPKVVAWGEIGLDYYRNYSPPEIQKKAFIKQLETAASMNLPVIIHIRDAFSDALQILSSKKALNLRGVLHSFSGEFDELRWAIDNNFYIGINGAITFKNFRMQEMIKKVPIDLLLLETDCPYLAPVPFRGKRNEPGHLLYTAQKLAEMLGIGLTELEKRTTANACQLFKIPMPPSESVNLFPQKRLSQNFLVDQNIARKMIKLVKPEEQVLLEIGPGKGSLTKIGQKECQKLYALELDYDLSNQLKRELDPEVVIVNRDFLQMNLAGFAKFIGRKPVIMGNIPYNITSPIIFKLVDNYQHFQKAVLMVQQEVGQRLVAAPDSRKYGIPTILVNLFFDVEIKHYVSSRAFHPKPSVTSVIISLKPLQKPRYPVDNIGLLKELVKGAFNQRRKMLYNALAESPFRKIPKAILSEAFEFLKIPRCIRPGKMTLEDYVNLTNYLSKNIPLERVLFNIE